MSNGYANRSNGLSNALNGFFLGVRTDDKWITNGLPVRTDNRQCLSFFICYWKQKLQDVGVRFVSLSRFQNEVAVFL